ncbi:MAG: alpha/beta hydrolase [Nocardioides sp.]|uniref:alpha/beta hydrolase n=1 Tax=Nocardioides sp. TaxID=35761 RepID=UPI003F0F8CA1
MKRWVAILAVVVLFLGALGATAAAVLALRGGGGGSFDPVSLPDDLDPRAAPAGLEKYYSQELEWSDCDGDDCAELTVPMDYAEPDGEEITIAVLRVPAGGDALGSMVVNPGGPGGSGTEYAKNASFAFSKALRHHFDVVGFDPRGTGRSTAIDCVTDDELDAYVAGDPVPETPAEIATVEAASKSFGAGCAARSGDLVNHVSTIEAARDMDVLRAALGDSQLTYFGASYGTKLGATYAELFPERVGRLVLDGGVDVSLDSTTMSLEQARGFEQALRAYVKNCVDTTERCFLGDDVDEGIATVKEILDDIEADPIKVGDRELTGGLAFYGVVTPLYASNYWVLLSTALRTAQAGNGTALLELADMYASRTANGYSDNSMEAIFAINCLDDPAAVPWSKIPDHFAEFEEASPTFGRVFAWGLAGCSSSKGRTTEEPLEIRAEGAEPIVVVGTTRDPATPYEWSEALADQLDSGVLVSRDGDGHTGYGVGNECVDEAVERYLIEGTVPADGLSC